MCLCGVVVIGGVCYWWCSFYVCLMTSSMEWSYVFLCFCHWEFKKFFIIRLLMFQSCWRADANRVDEMCFWLLLIPIFDKICTTIQ